MIWSDIISLNTSENRTDENIAADVRARRDLLLSQSDWTQLADVELTNRQAWTTYRQMLRDLSNNTNWPKVDFPDPPA